MVNPSSRLESPPATLCLGLALLLALLHTPTFYAPHIEGDELVYTGLASTMAWDLHPTATGQ